jgi:glyoxylase-like metal-dependent hydrolase (beta-lactamase superfamily II)
MELVELHPRLHMLRFDVGQAYLWQDRDGLTLVDTGPVGSGDDVAAAIRAVGREPGELVRVVLTHAHGDHAGSAAEIRRCSDAPVIAHRLEAPLIRGDVPIPAPVLLDWERPLFEQVSSHLGAPPVVVDQEVEDGDVLDFGGGATVLAVPGHTTGSIAIHLPAERVLLTGDAVAEYGGEVILGVFNLDRDELVGSVRRLVALDTEVIGFGHGDPVLSGGSARLRELAA